MNGDKKCKFFQVFHNLLIFHSIFSPFFNFNFLTRKLTHFIDFNQILKLHCTWKCRFSGQAFLFHHTYIMFEHYCFPSRATLSKIIYGLAAYLHTTLYYCHECSPFWRYITTNMHNFQWCCNTLGHQLHYSTTYFNIIAKIAQAASLA